MFSCSGAFQPLPIIGQVNDMNDALKPSWVKRRESQAILVEAKREARTEKEKAALNKIEAEGPEFWRQLLIELSINVHDDAIGGLGASGRITAKFNESAQEETCRVDFVKKGPIVGMTYVDLFYVRGDTKIRSHTKEGEAVTYVFCVVPGRTDLRVMPNDDVRCISAREMAEVIVDSLFECASEAL